MSGGWPAAPTTNFLHDLQEHKPPCVPCQFSEGVHWHLLIEELPLPAVGSRTRDERRCSRGIIRIRSWRAAARSSRCRSCACGARRRGRRCWGIGRRSRRRRGRRCRCSRRRRRRSSDGSWRCGTRCSPCWAGWRRRPSAWRSSARSSRSWPTPRDGRSTPSASASTRSTSSSSRSERHASRRRRNTRCASTPTTRRATRRPRSSTGSWSS